MAKALVIGGGIIGLSSAYYLSQQGHLVTVLDPDSPEHGASRINAGMIVPSHFIPLAAPGMMAMGLRMMLNPKGPFRIKPSLDPALIGWCMKFARACNANHVAQCEKVLRDLHLASRSLYSEWKSELPEAFELDMLGLYMICREQKSLDAERHLADRATELGLRTKVLNRDELAAEEPDVKIDASGAVLFEDDAQFSPNRLMASLRRVLFDRGVRFVTGEVDRFETSGNRITGVHSRGELVEAEEFVIATGTWTDELAALLDLRLPMMPGKGYSFDVPARPNGPRLKRCALLMEARVAVTPMNGGIRFGGTMEIGVKNHDLNAPRVQGIMSAVPRYFPEFGSHELERNTVRAGLRPCSPDGMPYIGRTKAASNAVIASGHGMMGMSLGPISGKIVADVLAGKTPEFDMSRMSPDRYA